jgi:ribokinase
MLDIITMGSNTLDIFAHTEKGELLKQKKSGRVTEFISYPVGSKLLVTELLQNFGGNGSNAAVNFSRLGLMTGYIGKVGRDLAGEQILQSLEKNKVLFLGGRGEKSGTSIILDAMGEDRTILTFKGCNNELAYKEVQRQHLNAKWLYLSSMLGESLKTLKKIAEEQKAKGVKIAFNPSQTLIDKEKKTALNIAKISDVLVLNKEEAQLLMGTTENHDLFKALKSLGPSVVVVTDGKNGASALFGNYLYTIKPKGGLVIVETTGAGDAFASTLTAGLITRQPIEMCLRLAVNQSENVIQGHGAQNHLADIRALSKVAANDKRRIDKMPF